MSWKARFNAGRTWLRELWRWTQRIEIDMRTAKPKVRTADKHIVEAHASPLSHEQLQIQPGDSITVRAAKVSLKASRRLEKDDDPEMVKVVRGEARPGMNPTALLYDVTLVESLASFDREKVPERLPHAKGSGAFGVFETTEDVSACTKASVFQQGASAEVLVRFSTVFGEQGSPDTWRDVRGFAVRLYTDEGNLDIVGNNTPVFFVRDPMKFPNFIRSQRRLPDSGLRSANMQWDFWTHNPETAHQVTYLMGDRGLPKSWRHMNGYSSHTYMWVNEAGERFWIKYHWHSDQGVENMTNEAAEKLAGQDADIHHRDLFDAIERGDFPSWTLSVQIMPYEEAKTYRFNPFDVTKVWPHADYPLHKVGKLTLNRNPENWFAEIEQAAFSPSNMVPGTGVSPDKMLLARTFSSPDAQRHRIGANWEADAALVRQAYQLREDDDDFGQAGTLVREVFDAAQHERLVQTVVAGMMDDVQPEVRSRVFEYWRNVDQGIGNRIQQATQANDPYSDFEAPQDRFPSLKEEPSDASVGVRAPPRESWT